jgi:hypothetical protein
VLHCLDTDILLHSILLYSTSSDPVEVAKRKRAFGRVVEGVRIVAPFR